MPSTERYKNAGTNRQLIVGVHNYVCNNRLLSQRLRNFAGDSWSENAST